MVDEGFPMLRSHEVIKLDHSRVYCGHNKNNGPNFCNFHEIYYNDRERKLLIRFFFFSLFFIFLFFCIVTLKKLVNKVIPLPNRYANGGGSRISLPRSFMTYSFTFIIVHTVN